MCARKLKPSDPRLHVFMLNALVVWHLIWIIIMKCHVTYERTARRPFHQPCVIELCVRARMQLNSLDRKCKILHWIRVFESENVTSHPALDFNCFLKVSEVEQAAGEGKSIRARVSPQKWHRKSGAVKLRFIDDPSIKSSRLWFAFRGALRATSNNRIA